MSAKLSTIVYQFTLTEEPSRAKGFPDGLHRMKLTFTFTHSTDTLTP